MQCYFQVNMTIVRLALHFCKKEGGKEKKETSKLEITRVVDSSRFLHTEFGLWGSLVNFHCVYYIFESQKRNDQILQLLNPAKSNICRSKLSMRKKMDGLLLGKPKLLQGCTLSDIIGPTLIKPRGKNCQGAF